MTPDELERLISRYDEADMSPEERAQLQNALAESPQARAILGEYQRLDEALSGLSAGSKPDRDLSEELDSVDYDALHARIIRAVDGIATSEGGVGSGLNAAEGREDSSRRTLLFRRLRRFSLAASVVVAALIGVAVWRSAGPGVDVPGGHGPMITRNLESSGSGVTVGDSALTDRRETGAVRIARAPMRPRNRSADQVMLASITRAARRNGGAIAQVLLASGAQPAATDHGNQEAVSLVVCSASPRYETSQHKNEKVNSQVDSSYYMLF